MTVFEELKRRGLIAQTTNEEKIKDLFDNQNVTFYIGFDATADSLHVGHFLQLVVMSHLQKAGHKPIVLLGTGTTMVGDPTGKTDMRKMLSVEDINYNAECFRKQMCKIIDFDNDKAKLVKNGDWLLKFNYIEFLRDVGVHFSVNRMLSAECFKSRLEKGLSFIEFNYMLMQSYDFLHLFREEKCMVELGGDDQWANIINGVDLVRRVEAKEVYGMTFTLLTTKEGKKMGKTEKGALWLDPEKTSPYEFFQYWRNVSDDDVITCLKLITFVPIEEIEAMQSLEGSELNAVKERLAFEVTKLVHGEDEANKALASSKELFSQNADTENMPSTEITSEMFLDGKIDLFELLVKANLCPSKGEARRLIAQGGISIDGEKINSNQTFIDIENFSKGNIVIKKGKKIFHKIILV
jgi:tyrosyl-tRNA synthetase